MQRIVRTYDPALKVDYVKKFDLLKGYYTVPHFFIELVSRKVLSKTDFILLNILFHLENRRGMRYKGEKAKMRTAKRKIKISTDKEWFWITDAIISKTRLISRHSIIESRHNLKERGFIEFIPGRPGKATQYKIALDRKYFTGKSTSGTKQTILDFEMK